MEPTKFTSDLSVTQPFQGLVVVELGHSVAAPFAGLILAEMGAEVIKVEKSDGDDARRWGPPFWEGEGAYFQALNRNKQSVVCNLRDATELEALRNLITTRADIVIQNLRPGHVKKLGLDAATLRARKPTLIYCNLGAFGASGPLKDRPGYDPLMQAFGGIMSTTGEPGRPSVRVAPSIVDMGTGMWAVIGILSALYQRTQTGNGHEVDVSLFETAATWASLLAAQVMASGKEVEKQGSGAPGIAPYKAYVTQDGEVVISAGSDSLFKSLSGVLGHPEWASDQRFKDNPSRVANQTELYRLIDSVIAAQPTAHWVAALEEAGVPCAPVNTIGQVLEHPQTQALDLIHPVPGTGMRFVALPVSFDGRRPRVRSAPPGLGAHTQQLLFPDLCE
ncbi:MAG: CaiB/BaiF CoA transferase family protein [Betaproteobacteria bacterium]